MKVTLLQNSLSKAVKTVGKTLQNKPQLPILSSILLVAEGDQLSLAATDLYMGIRITLPASIESEGVFAVQGRVLVEAISSLTGGKITLELEGDKLNVTSDTGASFSISGQSGEEYPEFPSKEGEEITFEASDFQMMEKSLGFATALDQARLTLTTLHLSEREGGLEVAATDGFRLAVLKMAREFGLSSSLLIPSKAVSQVSSLLEIEEDASSQVEIVVSESLKQVFLTAGSTEVFIRLVEGEYPPYQKIIPVSFLTEVKLDAAEFLQHLRQASVFARDVSNIVTLGVVGDQLEVKAQGPSGSYSSSLPVELIKNDQEVAEISFNVRYLLEFLQTMKPDKIWFGAQEALKPAMFKIEGFENYSYTVMPFRLNQA